MGESGAALALSLPDAACEFACFANASTDAVSSSASFGSLRLQLLRCQRKLLPLLLFVGVNDVRYQFSFMPQQQKSEKKQQQQQQLIFCMRLLPAVCNLTLTCYALTTRSLWLPPACMPVLFVLLYVYVCVCSQLTANKSCLPVCVCVCGWESEKRAKCTRSRSRKVFAFFALLFVCVVLIECEVVPLLLFLLLILIVEQQRREICFSCGQSGF